MRTKEQVEVILQDKLDQYLNSFPDIVKKDLSDHVYVAGGCIASLFLEEKPKDVDLYLDSTFTGCLSLVTQMEICDTTDISFNAFNRTVNGDLYQLIISFFGEPQPLTDNFDYLHTKTYYRAGTLYVKDDVLESIKTKSLVFDPYSRYPLSSFIRFHKYSKRGWNMSIQEQLKLALAVSCLDLTDLRIVKQQLPFIKRDDAELFVDYAEAFKAKKLGTEALQALASLNLDGFGNS